MADMKLLVENARLAGPQRTRPTTTSPQQAASAQRSQQPALITASKMGNSRSEALGEHGREGSALHPP
jgi:hypothetical protein